METWAETYRLLHSEPTTVFNWLRDSVKVDPWERKDIELALLTRKEPLVNLGLALYGSSIEVGHQLYTNGNSTIQRAVLSGSTIAGDKTSNFVSTWFAGL